MIARVFFLAIALLGLPVRAEDNLYHALGETAGIERFVARTADIAFADKRMADLFAHTKKDRLVALVASQICALAGGPCTYRGLTMKKAHVKLGITEHQFNAFAECLQAAMAEQGVPYHTQNRLLALLAPMKREIVER